MGILVSAYLAVLLAEVVGDKTLYSLGALASRYRALPILIGASAAFAIKIGAAVLLGSVLGKLPLAWIHALSAVTFLFLAVSLWLKKPEPELAPGEPRSHGPDRAGAASAFTSIAFSEWADRGQLAAVVLVAEYPGAHAAIFAGGLAAMITKGCVALVLGLGLRRWLPFQALRISSVALCCVLAVVAALGVD